MLPFLTTLTLSTEDTAVSRNWENANKVFTLNPFESKTFILNTSTTIKRRAACYIYNASHIEDLTITGWLKGSTKGKVQKFNVKYPGFIYTHIYESSTPIMIEINNTGSTVQKITALFASVPIVSSNDYTQFSVSPNDCAAFDYSSSSYDAKIYGSSHIEYFNMYPGEISSKVRVNLYDGHSGYKDELYAFTSPTSYITIGSSGETNTGNSRGFEFDFDRLPRSERVLITIKSNETTEKNGTYIYSSDSSHVYGAFSEQKKCHSLEVINNVTDALVIAVAVYFSIVGVLLILNIIAACMHPNRLYRLGITYSCCYCCCADRYSSYDYYYGHHVYSRPIFCYCDCGSSSSSSSNDTSNIIALIILLIVLIVLAFILMYTLYLLCTTADEEEREYEAKEKSGDTTVVIINNQSPPVQAPLMAPQPQYAPPPQPMMGQPQYAAPQPQPMMGQPQYAAPQPQPMMGQPQYGVPQQPMMQPQPMMGQAQPMMQPQQPMMGQPYAQPYAP